MHRLLSQLFAHRHHEQPLHSEVGQGVDYRLLHGRSVGEYRLALSPHYQVSQRPLSLPQAGAQDSLCCTCCGLRAHQQPSFCPGVRRPLALRRDDLTIVIALRDAVGLPIGFRPLDFREGLRAFPQCRKLLPHLIGGHLQCRQWAQVKVAMGLDARARVQCGHFTIANIQQAWLLEAGSHPGDGGQIQRVVSPLPESTSVASGMPKGSSVASITLSCGKSGRWSLQ
jgi:hypothetical protein